MKQVHPRTGILPLSLCRLQDRTSPLLSPGLSGKASSDLSPLCLDSPVHCPTPSSFPVGRCVSGNHSGMCSQMCQVPTFHPGSSDCRVQV